MCETFGVLFHVKQSLNFISKNTRNHKYNYQLNFKFVIIS